MSPAYDDLDRPPLHEAALRRALTGDDTGWREVVVVEETASTNQDLAARARAGAAPGSVLVAEHQTGGRGRLDRVWTSPPRSGITVSMLVQPSGVPLQRWPWLPLLAGVAVAEAVRRSAKVEATLKWPNDVLVGDRKLAGILSERIETATASLAVVGVGLNVSLRSDEVPTAEATSLLLERAETTDRTVVLREVLRVFDQLFAAWVRERGDPAAGLAQAYADRCSTLGRQVRVGLPDGATLAGEALRVDDHGRLLVRTGEGESAVGAGDVVHVRRA
ncbi:MAG: biotin--[acetyl-CoA-carboxylase] ligase [Actinomycetota bacterium]|nr:biotin--[acetyl-CoA-carboxylase] ligase [Actinomycetota bacterium]